MDDPFYFNEGKLLYKKYDKSFRQDDDNDGDLETTTSPFFMGSMSDTLTTETIPRPQIDSVQTINASTGMPIIHGVPIVSVHELPDRLRTIFSFPAFNAMQSRCFGPTFKSDNNLVVSAPTASGKTTVLELAICRLLTKESLITNTKIVYIGPTRALCDERYEDWSTRFRHLGVNCGLITGESGEYQHGLLQRSQLIITTPEKWDSITRRLQDRDKLMRLVKLVMVDEIHILSDERGATIESVISRVKATRKPIRFVALSATIPNANDVATWLGRDHQRYDLPAHLEVFGEEFRPSRLFKFVLPIPNGNSVNGHALEARCNALLPEIIREHSNHKPILIFCPTRNSAESTAKGLASYWNTTEKLWRGSKSALSLQSTVSKEISIAGIACHHAGLIPEERQSIEQAFLTGELSIICCTSTLAVGINLPCYLVIIKNTMHYKKCGEFVEYSDLDIMQMLGRAGRPQFGDHGRGIIMTKPSNVQKYEALLQSRELLESHLHLNLAEHLNAEIVLGTIRSLHDAISWLMSTFFYVRLQRNQAHYKVEGLPEQASVADQVEYLCTKHMEALRSSKIVQQKTLRSTAFGELMAKQYVRLKTMTAFMQIPNNAKVVDILAVLATAEELHEVKFRPGETALYNELNKCAGLKYPCNSANKSERKRVLLMQAELGSVPYPSNPDFVKFQGHYRQDTAAVFSNIHRLVRCLVDTRRLLGDGFSVRSGLEVSRSLAARAWDDSPMILKQLPKVGPATLLKLQNLGIKTMEDLRRTPVERLDRCQPRIPLFGTKLVAEAQKFPSLRISVRVLNQSRSGGFPLVHCEAEIGFLNSVVPKTFGLRRVCVHLLIVRSDGLLVDLRQITDITNPDRMKQRFSVKVESPEQSILCYSSCDELAGTLQEAIIHPGLSKTNFPAISPPQTLERTRTNDKEFDDADLMDEDLLGAEDQEFVPINSMVSDPAAAAFPNPAARRRDSGIPKLKAPEARQRLKNGKFACNHTCKDKSTCKHGECCREGLDKPPQSRTKEINTNKTAKRDDHAATNQPTISQALLPYKKPSKAKAAGSFDARRHESPQRTVLATLHQNVVGARSPNALLGPKPKVAPGVSKRHVDRNLKTPISIFDEFLGEDDPEDIVLKSAEKRKQSFDDRSVVKKVRVSGDSCQEQPDQLQRDPRLPGYRPFKNMEGIDLDIVARLAEVFEFVD